MLRALLLLACLTTIVPAASAEEGNQGSYVCEAETSEAGGSPFVVRTDPLTVAVQNPTLPPPGEEAKAGYVGVSVYPAGNGPCVILPLPAV